MAATRRQLLAAPALERIARAAASGSERPNILWITCEDLSPILGCYGDSYAYTPQLDRLAAEGVRYTRAFSTATVCAPGRSGLITGMQSTSLGTMHLRGFMPLARGVNCFPAYLRQAGYYTSNNEKQDYNFVAPADAWDESSGKAHWRNRRPGQPFFSVFNLLATHQGQIRYSREKFLDVSAGLPPEARHDPEKAPLPPYYPGTPDVRLNIAELYTQATIMDRQAGGILDQLEQDGLAGGTIVFFFSDHGTGLPRGKRWLHDSGTRVPFIVRFPEKYRHLAPAPPGGVVDRLVSFEDFAHTVLALAGLAAPPHMTGGVFLGKNAAPPRRYIFAARDRVDEVLETSRAIRDERFLYIRNYLPHRPRMQHSDYSEVGLVRKELRRLHAEGKLSGDAAWLMSPTKPAEELYDTQADPHQMRNLAAAPEHGRTLERLRAGLRAWMLRIRDTGLLPEDDMAARAGAGSPYDIPRKKFPVERILDAAELVGRGARHLAAIQKGLRDPDPAVRYWGAVGLTALGAEARPALAALRAALDDPAPSVRIAAAEAAVNLGAGERALSVLAAALAARDSRVALQAAIVLWYLGDKARPATGALHDAAQSASEPKEQRQYVQWSAKKSLARLSG